MTNNDEMALNLKSAAEKALPAIEKYESGQIDGDDALEMLSDFTDVIKPVNILALLAERDADKKRIAELEESHKKLRETMAAIHNTIRADGAYTPLAAIMSGVKRAYEDSAAVAGIKLEVGE